GHTLADFLRRHFTLDQAAARDWVRSGKISVNGKPCANPERLLRKGQVLQVRGMRPRARRGPDPEGRRPKAPGARGDKERPPRGNDAERQAPETRHRDRNAPDRSRKHGG